MALLLGAGLWQGAERSVPQRMRAGEGKHLRGGLAENKDGLAVRERPTGAKMHTGVPGGTSPLKP